MIWWHLSLRSSTMWLRWAATNLTQQICTQPATIVCLCACAYPCRITSQCPGVIIGHVLPLLIEFQQVAEIDALLWPCVHLCFLRFPFLHLSCLAAGLVLGRMGSAKAGHCEAQSAGNRGDAGPATRNRRRPADAAQSTRISRQRRPGGPADDDQLSRRTCKLDSSPPVGSPSSHRALGLLSVSVAATAEAAKGVQDHLMFVAESGRLADWPVRAPASRSCRPTIASGEPHGAVRRACQGAAGILEPPRVPATPSAARANLGPAEQAWDKSVAMADTDPGR